MSEEKNTKGLCAHNKEMNKIAIESITQAFLFLMEKKDYSEISITDICRKAGISRTAFYKNFETKENIFRRITLEFNRNLLRKIGNPFNEKVDLEWYVRFFSIVKENRSLFELIIRSGFQKIYLDYVNNILTANSRLDKQVRYQRLMWNGAIQNATIGWIAGGMQETEEEMAGICFRIGEILTKSR